MGTDIKSIWNHFDYQGIISEISPLGEGRINDTFFIKTEGESPNYILQRKNKNIFTDIPAMMENIQKVTLHLKEKIKQAGGNPLNESLTIIPTKDKKLYYLDENREYWAACLYIKDTISYEKADSQQLAMQGGKGIGKFQSMLADMKEPLTNILPGFHDIRFRFKQWDETLTKDPENRKKELKNEIAWIEDRRQQMLDFWSKVEQGIIPIRVTHNDTKISNILFDKKGNVLCVIDLDTVLNSTCLNDFGDAIRSYTNAGKEDDENLNNVYMKIDFFKAYTQGYLSEAIHFLTNSEIENLAFAAKYITYEQVLRFLMDYIDGDHYYKITKPEDNLIRTKAQYKLLVSMEENFEKMQEIVHQTINQIKNNKLKI